MLSLVVVALLALFSLHCVAEEAAPYGTSPTCNRDKFIAAAPRAARLSFCLHHSSSTCCDAAHTDPIAYALAPLWTQDGVTDECRRWSSLMHCSICESRSWPVCKRSCKRWFRACANAPYTVSHDRLAPCTDSDVVCANLSTIVSDGSEFCRMSGLTWAKGTGEKDSCFNPEEPAYQHVSIPMPRVASKQADAASTSSTASSTPSSSPEAEAAAEAVNAQLRELDRLRKLAWRRAQRAFRRGLKWFREHPEATALTSVVLIVSMWLLSFLYRRGVLAAWSRRCRHSKSASNSDFVELVYSPV
jgi:hypothetical protein